MKLSNLTAKLTCVATATKQNAVRILATAAFAGAVLIAAAPAAQAQHFGVAVRVGGPVYGPVYGPRYYAPRRPVYFAPRVYGGYYGYHDGFRRHEEWVRDHRFGYAHPY